VVNFSTPFNQIAQHQKDFLTGLLSNRNIGVGVELGSWLGESSSVLAKHCNKLYCVDSWQGNKDTALQQVAQGSDIYSTFMSNIRELGINNIVPIKGDTSSAAVTFGDGSVDFIYIDADHTYSGVTRDIEAWWPKLKVGGLMAGHDFEGTHYVEQYVEMDYSCGIHHGVIKAVLSRFPDVKHDHGIWYVEREK
jgi:predicted O-methyltransferase YrrM